MGSFIDKNGLFEHIAVPSSELEQLTPRGRNAEFQFCCECNPRQSGRDEYFARCE